MRLHVPHSRRVNLSDDYLPDQAEAPFSAYEENPIPLQRGGRILRMPWRAGGPEPQDTVPSVKRLEKEDSMSLSRRHFFWNLGLGSAGLLSTPFVIGRGHEAFAFEAGARSFCARHGSLYFWHDKIQVHGCPVSTVVTLLP